MKKSKTNISINAIESIDDSDSKKNIDYIKRTNYFTPKSYTINNRLQNINNTSTNNKIIPKKSVDFKISYIGDIKNEFGIYSNRLSKIEKEAESYAILKKKIQLIKQTKFENQTLRKINVNINEHLPRFDLKNYFKEKNKIFFESNKPILLNVRKTGDTECKLNKINRKYLTYLINFNKKHRNKYFTVNIFDRMNKISKKKKEKSTLSKTKNRNTFEMNRTVDDSFFSKNFTIKDNCNNFLKDMLQVKKISRTELNGIRSRLYGSNSFKKSFNENKENYFKDSKIKQIFDLNYSANNKNKYGLNENSSGKDKKIEKNCLKTEDKFKVDEIKCYNNKSNKSKMCINIESNYINSDINGQKIISDFKHHHSSSFVKNKRGK